MYNVKHGYADSFEIFPLLYFDATSHCLPVNVQIVHPFSVLDVSVESTSVESAPTVVNGEVKGSGKTPLVSINSPVAVSGNEASSDSTSPRTQSLVS